MAGQKKGSWHGAQAPSPLLRFATTQNLTFLAYSTGSEFQGAGLQFQGFKFQRVFKFQRGQGFRGAKLRDEDENEDEDEDDFLNVNQTLMGR